MHYYCCFFAIIFSITGVNTLLSALLLRLFSYRILTVVCFFACPPPGHAVSHATCGYLRPSRSARTSAVSTCRRSVGGASRLMRHPPCGWGKLIHAHPCEHQVGGLSCTCTCACTCRRSPASPFRNQWAARFYQLQIGKCTPVRHISLQLCEYHGPLAAHSWCTHIRAYSIQPTAYHYHSHTQACTRHTHHMHAHA